MNSSAAKPAATMLSFSDREGYFNLAAPTVATLTFCLQPVVSCQLCPPSPSLCPLCLGVWSDACCRLEGVVGNGMSAVNIYAAQCSYRVGKGDDVSFLTAAEFVACLQS